MDDELLSSVLSERAAAVDAPAMGWAENQRRVRRDSRRRGAAAAVLVVAVAGSGVLGFRFVHEAGRGQPLPVRPLSTHQPAP
jgi:hypothetical protein